MRKNSLLLLGMATEVKRQLHNAIIDKLTGNEPPITEPQEKINLLGKVMSGFENKERGLKKDAVDWGKGLETFIRLYKSDWDKLRGSVSLSLLTK